MREWVSQLEAVIDKKLKLWRKDNKIENGEAVQLSWQYEQTHIHFNIFWEDKKETIKLQYLNPRGDHAFLWHGLDDKTIDMIHDRIGNLAQITMHPPIRPAD
jgi:hypothetical protein